VGKVLLFLVLVVGLFVGGVWLRYGTVSPCGVLRVQVREVAEDKAQQGAELLGGELGKVAGALTGSLSDAAAAQLVEHLSPTQCARGVVRVWMGDAPIQPGDVDLDVSFDLD